MSWQFTPNEAEADRLVVPFFEDATADFAPYYSSGRSIKQAKAVVSAEIAKLGGAVSAFVEGTYSVGQHATRHGYEIRFTMNGHTGRIMVAGLPIRKETEARVTRCRVQALLNVGDWLKSSVTLPVFSPGGNPLALKLLIPGENITFEEKLMSSVAESLALPRGEIIE